MKTLGYLISPTKLKNVADFIEITDDVSKFDTELPAIIIGLSEAKKKIKDFSILKKKYENDKFWTFGKTERRVDFDKDLSNFYDYVLSKSINGIKYTYIDILCLPPKRVRGMIRFFLSPDVKYAYIYNGMLYVYYGNNILGISLTIAEYCGVNVKKWVSHMIKNKAIRIYYNDAKIDSFIKQYSKNKRYLIPYFYSLIDEN